MSQAKLDMAKEQETYAKISEVNSETEHKKTEADLNLVKLMIELEDMDHANFKNSWDMAQVIKAQTKKEQEQLALNG